MERFLMYFAFGFGLGWAFHKHSFAVLKIGIAGILLGVLSQVLLGFLPKSVGCAGAAGLGALGGAWVWKRGEPAFAVYVNRIRAMLPASSRFAKGVNA